jgi:hypothetical protein
MNDETTMMKVGWHAQAAVAWACGVAKAAVSCRSHAYARSGVGMPPCLSVSALCLLLALSGCSSPPSPAPTKSTGGQAASGTPATAALSPAARLYDAGQAGVSLSRSAWTAVPEGDLAPQIKTHLVMANDCVAVDFMLGPGSPIERSPRVGAQEGDRLVSRTSVQPMIGPPPTSEEDFLPALASVRVVENSSAAVAVEATFAAEGGKEVTATYRLTTGQPILEIRPGPAAGRLAIGSALWEYAVAPNYFGDDWLRDAYQLSSVRAGLPAENCFLALRGDSMMMCTWASSGLNADAVMRCLCDPPAITDFEVECLPGKPVWLAFMGGPQEFLANDAQDAGVEAAVAMKQPLPFSAKWRLCAMNPNTRQWTTEGTFNTGRHLGYAGSLVMISGNAVTVKRWSHLDPQSKFPRLVFYPLDRNPETPLDIFTPMDVLRNTLGVGPCQYVLDTEGLGSTEAATPEAVAAWIEKRLARSDAAAAGEEIKARLAAMTAHVGRAMDREKAYDDFTIYLHEFEPHEPLQTKSAAVTALMGSMNELQMFRAYRNKDVQGAAEKVKAVADGIGAALSPDDAKTLRDVGAAIDRSLAEYRMYVRCLKQAARAVEWDAAATDEERATARKILARAEAMLAPPVISPR